MSKYVYAGPAAAIGRFGGVETGQVLELDENEAAQVQGNSNWFALPSRRQKELKVTANHTLTGDDAGKVIVCNATTAITITLPAEPSLGDTFEIAHGDASAGDNVTVAPAGQLGTGDDAVDIAIDGVDGNDTITAADDSKGYYWNGLTWIPF